MKIQVLNQWHESYKDSLGQPYNAIIDGDNDNIVKISDTGKMFYSVREGCSLYYKEIPQSTEVEFVEPNGVKAVLNIRYDMDGLVERGVCPTCSNVIYADDIEDYCKCSLCKQRLAGVE